MADSLNKNLRTAPQNNDAERALLGALMLKPDAMHDVADVVFVDSFYVDKHRYVYSAIFDLFSKGEPIDILSVASRLKETKRLEQIGGNTFLSELVNTTPAAGNANHYAALVSKSSTLRNLIDAGEYVAELGYNESMEVDEALDKAEKRVYEVTDSPSTHKFQSMRTLAGDAFDRYERLSNSTDELRGVPSGFKDLDNLLAGFQPADLIILAARPSMGKSALMLDITRHVGIHKNIPIGIFSLEMGAQQLVDRMLASEAYVDAWKLRTGRLSNDTDFENLQNAISKLSSAPIFIDDQPANNILAMRSVARRLKREQGLGMLIVDYLQLMAPTQSKNSDNVVQQVTEISRSLKQLARELEVPVIALSQLSRAVEQRRGKPRLSDLRDSGSIEQDADVVMFIHREDRMSDDYDPNADGIKIAEILVEKHRNGAVGSVQLAYDDKKVTFRELAKSDYGALQTAASGADDDFF